MKFYLLNHEKYQCQKSANNEFNLVIRIKHSINYKFSNGEYTPTVDS